MRSTVILISLLLSGPAFAADPGSPEDPESKTRWSVAGLFGFSTNSFGVGAGARAGVLLSRGLYVGGTAVYYFGAATGTTVSGTNAFDSSFSALQVGGEAGYAFFVKQFVLRPYGGIGTLSTFAGTSTVTPIVPRDAAGLPTGAAPTNSTTTTTTDNRTTLAFWAGITGAYKLPDSPYAVGAEFRMMFPVSSEVSPVGLFATFSARL